MTIGKKIVLLDGIVKMENKKKHEERRPDDSRIIKIIKKNGDIAAQGVYHNAVFVLLFYPRPIVKEGQCNEQ